MFSPDRNALRHRFFSAWRKARDGAALEPLEARIAEVIRRHPEYHRWLEDPETALARDFSPEEGTPNPFLHLGLHLAVLEQLASDRPPGLRAVYRRMIANSDAHEAEHRLMDCLGQILWKAQRAGRMPDESAYLDCLRQMPVIHPRN